MASPIEIVEQLVRLNPDYYHNFHSWPRNLPFSENLPEGLERKDKVFYLYERVDANSLEIGYSDIITNGGEIIYIFNPTRFEIKIEKYVGKIFACPFPYVSLANMENVFDDFDVNYPVLPKKINDIYAIIFQKAWTDESIVKKVLYREGEINMELSLITMKKL